MKTEEALNQHSELKLILKVSPKPNLRENLCYLTLNIIVMLLHIQSTTQYQTLELIQILFQPKPISKTLRKKWEEKSRPHQPVVKVLGITRLNSMTTLEASFQILWELNLNLKVLLKLNTQFLTSVLIQILLLLKLISNNKKKDLSIN